MKKKYLWIFIGLGVFLLTGCAETNDDMYVWGDFSRTQYQMQKSPGEESVQAYQSVLEEIVKQSESRGSRVPPGVYASLGWIYARRNSPTQAIDCFMKEKAIYPEATVFMDQLIKQSSLREEALSEEPSKKATTADSPTSIAEESKETPKKETSKKGAKK